MEAQFQAYRGRINFLWVYGSEAHPEEHPFMDGYESADLGWNHPYSITHSVEERAQRAKWMKTDPDPDSEIPMMVDYVDSPGHSDDEIRAAYYGSGFYSGYVIDCDGTVTRAHTWGWYGPGGEWWGLPLADIADLRAYLDEYLADPPPCYRTDDLPSDPDAGPDPSPDPSVDAGVPSGRDAGDEPNADPDPSGEGAGGVGLCATGSRGSGPISLLLILAAAQLASRARRRG